MLDFQYRARSTVDDFRTLVHLLRQKDGCPWDSVQTHHSIRDNFLEETYEACEAIDNEDTALLREELGDVLMQVIFHASIEEDAGHFDLDDVADTACRKLIFRHPFLFQENAPAQSWEELKSQEKGFTSRTQALEAVARSLPALWRAKKLQKRAADAGFHWNDTEGPLRKAEEELSELREAVASDGNVEEELGDLLFALVAVARAAGIDPEHALNRASDKFIRRFGCMEALAEREMGSLSQEEYLALWQRAKEQTCSYESESALLKDRK
ncbi:MAG: nucleoside triphosphate pyrophosphohydrolase [Oscillospiraceae bacterium]|nr:nucleoside triphosphate pyrophosphohydrolase [Oscillospiraceae bacterium]